MKAKRIFSLLIVILCLFSGCSDDDDNFVNVDGLVPTITLESSNIKTEPGRQFLIKAKVEDKDGLKSINLKNLDIYLDKTIDLKADSIIYSFDLNYKFTTQKTLEGDSFPLVITATDLGGRITTETIVVTMDGDFEPPVFKVSPDAAVTVLLKTETKLNLKFTVEDDKAMGSVDIQIPEISYSKTITTFTNSNKTLEFSDQIQLPSTLGSYNLTITATDKSGLKTVKTSVISVSEMPDFSKMYLADVADAASLNSDIFGVPMLIEHTGEYKYRARYYSEAAGTKVRFIPQKTDFSPIAFGTDLSNSNLLTDDPDVSGAIVLPGRGYYEIVFNVKTGVYSVTPYTPTDAPVAIGTPMLLNSSEPEAGSIPLQIGLVGGGIPDAGSWDTAKPLILKQDPNNPYLFYVEMKLEAGKEIDFIIQTQHSWGWWPEPYWRWDRSEDPETNVANGGENPGKWKVATSGKYMFKFDSHLKRSKFYPIN